MGRPVVSRQNVAAAQETYTPRYAIVRPTRVILERREYEGSRVLCRRYGSHYDEDDQIEADVQRHGNLLQQRENVTAENAY